MAALGPDDKVAVIAFDDEATVVQPLTVDHDAALAAIGRLRPDARGTRFGAGLRAARELFTEQGDATGGEVLVVTDLQRSGAASVAGLSLPPNITVRAVDVAPRAHGNTAIAGIDVQRLPGGEPASRTADRRGAPGHLGSRPAARGACHPLGQRPRPAARDR